MHTAIVINGRVVGTACVMASTVAAGIPAGAEAVECAEGVAPGWTYADGVFAPPVPDVIVTPPQYKLLFTPTERVAIKAAAAEDPLIADMYTILDDPRLTEVNLSLMSTQASLMYLVSAGLLTPERVTEISTGVIR